MITGQIEFGFHFQFWITTSALSLYAGFLMYIVYYCSKYLCAFQKQVWGLLITMMDTES